MKVAIFAKGFDRVLEILENLCLGYVPSLCCLLLMLACVILNNGCVQVCVIERKPETPIWHNSSCGLVTSRHGDIRTWQTRKSFVLRGTQRLHERGIIFGSTSRRTSRPCGSISFLFLFRGITEGCNNLTCSACYNLTRVLPLFAARASSS